MHTCANLYSKMLVVVRFARYKCNTRTPVPASEQP